MLKRLAFLTLLIGSSAIPMQTQPIYQSRTLQSVEMKDCQNENEKIEMKQILPGLKKEKAAKIHCNN